MATLNLSVNGYQNIVDSFSVLNKYPVESVFAAAREDIFSGNIKFNLLLHLSKQLDAQLLLFTRHPILFRRVKPSHVFLLMPVSKRLFNPERVKLFVNATDIGNTLQLRREVKGDGFRYIATDYYETQVFRVGYSYKF